MHTYTCMPLPLCLSLRRYCDVCECQASTTTICFFQKYQHKHFIMFFSWLNSHGVRAARRLTWRPHKMCHRIRSSDADISIYCMYSQIKKSNTRACGIYVVVWMIKIEWIDSGEPTLWQCDNVVKLTLLLYGMTLAFLGFLERILHFHTAAYGASWAFVEFGCWALRR